MPRALLTFCIVCSSTIGIWLAACGTYEMDAVDDDDDSSAGTREGGLSECPDDTPEEGAQCTQPEGTTCPVGACNDIFVVCRGARWLHSESPPPTPACPAQAPTEGTACPRCFPTSLSCGFGCSPDGGTGGLAASCVEATDGTLTWRVRARECPTFDASVADADPQDGS